MDRFRRKLRGLVTNTIFLLLSSIFIRHQRTDIGDRQRPSAREHWERRCPQRAFVYFSECKLLKQNKSGPARRRRSQCPGHINLAPLPKGTNRISEIGDQDRHLHQLLRVALTVTPVSHLSNNTSGNCNLMPSGFSKD